MSGNRLRIRISGRIQWHVGNNIGSKWVDIEKNRGLKSRATFSLTLCLGGLPELLSPLMLMLPAIEQRRDLRSMR
jgi:hypothetical protein